MSLSDTKTVAISYFDNTSGTKEYDPLSKGFADMMITDLSDVESIQIVEREKLQNLLSEIKLGDSKYFDPKTAQKLGKGLSADMILTGAFLSFEPMIRIDARLIDVGSGKVIQSNKVEGQASEFFKLQSKLADLIKRELKIKLNKAFPKKNQSVKLSTIINYSKSIDYSDKGLVTEAERILEKTIEEAPSFSYASIKLQSVRDYLNSIKKEDERIQLEKVRSLIENLDPDNPEFINDVYQITASLSQKMYSFDMFLKQLEKLNFNKDKDLGGYTFGDWLSYGKCLVNFNQKNYDYVLDIADEFFKSNGLNSIYKDQMQHFANIALFEFQKREKGKAISAELISEYNELYAHLQSLSYPTDYHGYSLECCDSNGKITEGELRTIWRNKYFVSSSGKHSESAADEFMRLAPWDEMEPVGYLEYEFNFVSKVERLKIYANIYRACSQYYDEISIRKEILINYEITIDEAVSQYIQIGKALQFLGSINELQALIENLKDEYPIPGWAESDLWVLENYVITMTQ